MTNYDIFKPILKRTELLSHNLSTDVKKIKIAVHRNHSFEMVANIIEPFLNFSKLSADFLYGDYDDSLNFQIPDKQNEFDIELIWLDLSRYKDVELLNWLKERLTFLRSTTNAPILLLHSGEKDLFSIENSITGLLIANMQDTVSSLGDGIWDIAKEKYSGTRFSNKACLSFARVIGCHYIPAVLKPAIKAIVLDLDNTLYQGVLGEDGVEGIIPHFELQKSLKKLKDKGFFLAIASKNELEDVQKMFAKREDFILKWDDFSAYGISWDAKSKNISEISKVLNIGIDSILFIDDNVGEIENVKSHYPDINTIEATSPEAVIEILKFYPGLYKTNLSFEDSIRSNDLKANAERKTLSIMLTEEEYFEKLEIKLTYAINPISEVKRISELLNKTNQFIFAYKRYNETQVKDLITKQNSCIVTISLSDRLSDSGIIAIVVAEKHSEELFIDEVCISCRALGRNLEDKILAKAFDLCSINLQTKNNLKIEYKVGERNKPALNWIQNYFGTTIETNGILSVNEVKEESFNGLTMEIV